MNYEIGGIVTINKQEYRIIKVYPKKIREHDVFLCENIKNGYKECYTRYNLRNRHEYLCKKDGPKVLWTKEEKAIVREGIEKGMTLDEITELLPNRTKSATDRIFKIIKMEVKDNGKERV